MTNWITNFFPIPGTEIVCDFSHDDGYISRKIGVVMTFGGVPKFCYEDNGKIIEVSYSKIIAWFEIDDNDYTKPIADRIL